MAKVFPSLAARADLLEIREYSIEQFGGDVADNYFLGFDEAFDLLADHPLIGAVRPDLGKGIRCLAHRRHRIFYCVERDAVLIVRIVHHARDARRTLKGEAG